MWSINGITFTLTDEQKTQVLIDTCTQLGFDIPRFCYHENLKIAGNCRMCLIEDSKAPKPVICCAGNPSPDLNIFTNTIQVKKSRESVMEFLLINHPLDCPICDQGGECDLQDLSLVYGSDHGRFYDYKRNVEDKNCGPVVKTVMNRCILCTRCVRFASDIAGFEALGLTGRGGKMEIGSYVEKIIDSDLSGNLIDVCPVGALTSKPYSFVSRPWEIKKANLFSLVDDQPQFIRADIKENEIVRFLPSKNAKGLNIWITNRTRFSYEGLSRNRVIDPIIFGQQTTWVGTLNVLKNIINTILNYLILKQKRLLDITFGDISNFDYFDLLSVKTILFSAGLLNKGNYSSFTFLPRVSNTLGNFDNVFLINLNLNYEMPITALMLQQSLFNKVSPFMGAWRSIITPVLKTFVLNLDSSILSLLKFFEGKTWFNSLFTGSSPTLCIYTFEWTNILSNLKTSFLKFFNLFLFTPGIACRTLVDIGLFSKNFLFSSSINSFSFLNWTLGETNKIKFINSSLSLLNTTHQILGLEKLSFVLPTKSYIENNTIFYSQDYTSLRSVKAISSPANSKTIKNFTKVLYSLLNLKPSPNTLSLPLNSNGKMLWDINITTNISYFWGSPFNILKKKILSKTEFYQNSSILTHSPTLSALQRATFNLNIY